MSIHIGAEPGEIAPAVLLPGDPLRARYIAETFLEDVSCYNEVRAMYGYTGRYGDKRISVQGSGMGMPSLAIYVNELVQEYGVQTIIRVGTCGALQPHLGIGDLVLAMTASTDSHMNRLRFDGKDYAPAADFDLLLQAYNAAKARGYTVEVGSIVTSDTFYADDDDAWDKWIAYGALACEMETSQLYTLAAKFRIRALSILTVSNSLVTGEEATAEQRERDFPRMAEVALDIVS